MTTIYSITGETLYQSSHQSLKAAVEAAVAEGVSLQRANLRNADLQGANLQGANLQNANLTKANLALANLTKANLQGANLTKAYLVYVWLIPDSDPVTVVHTIDGPIDRHVDGHAIISAATIYPIGGRNKMRAVLTEGGLYFETEGFTGSKESFLAAVESAHCHRDYKLAVEFLEAYLKEMKTTPTKEATSLRTAATSTSKCLSSPSA